MLQRENQTQSANFEWVCQVLSATGEPFDTSATRHCGVFLWEAVLRSPRRSRAWHRCALEPGAEGCEG